MRFEKFQYWNFLAGKVPILEPLTLLRIPAICLLKREYMTKIEALRLEVVDIPLFDPLNLHGMDSLFRSDCEGRALLWSSRK